MAKPKKIKFTFQQKMEKLLESGLHQNFQKNKVDQEAITTLTDRLKDVLNLVQKPFKALDMIYVIMYDIENNRVRKYIADYLIKKGSIRIQKSVYILRTKHKEYEEIHAALSEVNATYTNKDSIILFPLNVTDARSMKIIGNQVDLKLINDKPNTLFF